MTFKELRKKYGSQSYVAEQIGVSVESIKKWEREQRIPRKQQLMKLSEYFKIPMGELYEIICNTKEI